MKARLVLEGPSLDVSLRSIDESDLEDLRVWKNANRRAFFFKDEITPEMQRRWYEGFLARPDDHMFVVEWENLKAGCMGFRLLGGAADCYNIIGTPQATGRGVLRRAMTLMCSFIAAEHTREIGCKVLCGNPAVGWYQKCGFSIAEDKGDYYQMRLDWYVFSPCAYAKGGA